jgi:hypothetical protein
VAVDKSLIAARGPAWHKRDRERNKVPVGVDRDSTWGYSEHDGWVQGYSYEVVVSATPGTVVFPLQASVDTASTSDSFLYNWSEFTVSPTDALRVGLVVQRTRAYRTDRDVQRGLIVGYSYRRAELTACVFNPDEDKPTFAFSVGSRF